jgi:outer membrane protein TolC
VDAGTALALDLLRAKTEVVRRQGDLAQAKADLGRAELSLGILMGRSEPVHVSVPDVTVEVEAAAEGGDDVVALSETRPEIRAALEQAKAADAQAMSAWARYLPQLSASGAIFAADVPYPTGKKEGWRVSVDLSWLLYDGGYRNGQRRQAEANIDSARAALETQRLAAVQDIENARHDIAVARERTALAAVQRQLASDAAASAHRSFDAGVASTQDVLDANDKLFQAEVGMADARARLSQAILSLRHAVGRTP